MCKEEADNTYKKQGKRRIYTRKFLYVIMRLLFLLFYLFRSLSLFGVSIFL